MDEQLEDFKDHQHFRMDGKTEAEFHAEPLPASVTIPLRKEVAVMLASLAYTEDRTPEYIAARVLFEWAKKQLDCAVAISGALKSGDTAPKPVSTELQYQRSLLAEMRANELDARSQVPTKSGVADIVVFVSEQPSVVVELKGSLQKRRDVLQASGQARAYAEALSAPHHCVSAPEIAPDLLVQVVGSAPVYSAETIINALKNLIREQHVVSINSRR